jgi:preprotein translocase subunit SecD
MKTLLTIGLLAIWMSSPASVKHRTVEFHLLEDEPAAGLQAVDVTAPKSVKYMHPEAVLLGSDIAAVSAMKEIYGRGVEITFTHDGAAKLARVTAANIGKCLAVVIDGKVVMAPRIMAAMTTGVAQLSVGRDDSIEKIVAALQPLPVR